MTSYQVAQFAIQDVELVVVFLDPDLDRNALPRQRQDLYRALRACASQAGRTGEVVAVWQDEFGRTRFIAPAEQHPFLQVVRYDQLYAQVNGTLAC